MCDCTSLAHNYFYPANRSLQLPWVLQRNKSPNRDLESQKSLVISSLGNKPGNFRAIPVAGQSSCSFREATAQARSYLSFERETCAPQAAQRAMQSHGTSPQPMVMRGMEQRACSRAVSELARCPVPRPLAADPG